MMTRIVDGKILIEMDYQQIDQIVKETLMGDYRRIRADLSDVIKRGETEPLSRIDKEDFNYWGEMKIGLETVLQYYMSSQDYVDFMKSFDA